MNTNLPYTDVTFVLLAGGQSKRMGSDKGLLTLENTTFSHKLLELAKEITPNVIVSVGAHNKDLYPTTRTVEDTIKNLGPIGGITSVLPFIKTDWFFLVSVDTPLVNKVLLNTLWVNKRGHEAIVFGTDSNIHPLTGLYHMSKIKKWTKALDNRDLKVTRVVKGFNIKIIEASNDINKLLKNINTPKEYKELTKG